MSASGVVPQAFDAPTLSPDLLIGGACRPAAGGSRMEVVDPATGTTVGTVADGTVEDGLEAVAAAQAAGPAWAAEPPRRRAEALRRMYEEVVRRADWLAALISLENGKTLADAAAEVRYAAEFFRWFAEEAVRHPGELRRAPLEDARILVTHRPVGVCLLVTPWNFPAAMVARKVAPALAAGCTCVLKPAAETPLTAFAIASMLADAGVPPAVVNVVATSQPEACVAAILADPGTRKLSFTGSTRVGRQLLRQAADRVVRCSMELGGNAPFLVLRDADLDAAVEGALFAKMRNGGQACTAANRFLVHRSLHDRFCERLASRMAALRLGPGGDPRTGLAPLISEAARSRVAQMVGDEVAGGAKILTGGRVPDRPGFYYPATVLTDLSASSRMLDLEIFGPVAPVVAFDDEDEVVERANASELGLASYIYTGDLARGLRLAERMECGMTAINRGSVSDAAAPFGGMKQSGIGREGGREGMLEYLETQYVSAAW